MRKMLNCILHAALMLNALLGPAGATALAAAGLPDSGQGLTAAEQKIIEKFDTLGYLDAVRPLPEEIGVTVHRQELAQDGHNLYISGDRPAAYLTDMAGKIIHRWAGDLRSLGKFKALRRTPPFRRVHLLPDGALLALYDGGLGLVKLDRDSGIIWTYLGTAHHDLFVTEEGLIYLLTRDLPHGKSVARGKAAANDAVVVLSPEGKELRSVDLRRCFENSHYAPMLRQLDQRKEGFYLNTIEVLDGRLAERSPAFRKGNVLLSFLRLNAIGVVDLEREQLVWALSGMWIAQHQPTVLDNGNMLIFDNHSNTPAEGWSRILEFDPFTQEVVWEYRGTDEKPFYSHNCGSVARLSNGNTLITESNGGRAFEVTPAKEIVWEFYNPHRPERLGNKIAQLFEVIRLEQDFPLSWLR